MKKILVILLSILILSGCSSKFEREMEKGKTALRNGDYQEAADRFDSALIEKPNDKDTQALLERANISIESKRLENVVNEFTTDVEIIINGMTEINKKYGESMYSLSVDEANENIPISDGFYQKLSDLKTKWSTDDDMKIAYDILYNASIELRSIFENLAADVHDPFYDDLSGKDPFEVIRHRNETNDSSIRAEISYDEFQRKLSDYKEEIKSIKSRVYYK